MSEFERNVSVLMCEPIIASRYVRGQDVYILTIDVDGILWEVRNTEKTNISLDSVIAIRPVPPNKFYNLF